MESQAQLVLPHKTLYVLLAPLLVLVNLAVAEPVFIEAGQRGQGVLRGRAGECFILLPAHVLAGHAEARVVAAGRLESQARQEASYPPDLAVMHIVEGQRPPCSAVWDEGRGLDSLLRSASQGELITLAEDGSLRRRFVRLVEVDERFILVRPESESDRSFQGMSGSALRVRGRPVGMLMRVQSSGEAVVLRQDYLSDLTRRFFDVTLGDAIAPVGSNEGIEATSFQALATLPAVVHRSPDVLSERLGRLEVGELVRVTGRVQKRLWYRIERRDGTHGFISSEAVKPL